MNTLFFTLLLLAVPVSMSFAQVAPPQNFKGLVDIIINLIGTLIILIFALTFIVFMWGLIKGWILNGGDSDGVSSGKNVLVAGIIALVVMSSIWGILYLFQSSLFGA